MAILRKIRKDYGGFENAIALIGETCLEQYSDRLYASFCKTYEQATYITNMEWLLRHYHASKKIALSALFFTQAEDLMDKKMKNITFYVCYYSLFNALSSNLILHPDLAINDVRQISHGRLFKDIDNYFVRFKIYDNLLINLLNNLRLTREMYSYHLPLSGSNVGEGSPLSADALFSNLESKLTPILQISNLLSFISYYAWEKKVGKSLIDYDLHQEQIDPIFFSFIEHHDHLGKHCLIDDDDYSRQGYAISKIKVPFPVNWFMTKICEDIECGWEQDELLTGYRISNMTHYLSEAIDVF